MGGHGLVLGLFQNFHQPVAPFKLPLGGLIQVAPELGKGRQLTKLGHIQLEGPGHLFHGLGLGSPTHPGDGQTHINSRANTGEEQGRFQINLAVCDGDYVSGNVCGDITRLGLDDGQCRERTGTQFIVQFGCPFQKTGMVIKNVTRIGLTARWSPQKE